MKDLLIKYAGGGPGPTKNSRFGVKPDTKEYKEYKPHVNQLNQQQAEMNKLHQEGLYNKRIETENATKAAETKRLADIESQKLAQSQKVSGRWKTAGKIGAGLGVAGMIGGLMYNASKPQSNPQANQGQPIPQNSGTTMKPKANSNSIGGLNSSGSKLHNITNSNNQQGNSLRGALQSRGPLLGQQTSKPGQKFGHEGYQGYGPENRPNMQMGSNIQGSGMNMNRGGQQQSGMNSEMQRVMQLQQNLIKAGFPIQADGMWGPQTEKAYFAWKRNNSGNLDNAESQGGVYRDRASDGMADAESQGGVFRQQQPQVQVQESTTPLDYNEVEQSMPMVPQGQGNQSSMESESDKWNRLAGTQNQAPQRKRFLGGLFGR